MILLDKSPPINQLNYLFKHKFRKNPDASAEFYAHSARPLKRPIRIQYFIVLSIFRRCNGSAHGSRLFSTIGNYAVAFPLSFFCFRVLISAVIQTATGMATWKGRA